MPEEDLRHFVGKATTVIRQKGNPLNVQSSRMLERLADLKEAARLKTLSPEQLNRYGEAAGEFKGAQQIFKKLSAGQAGAEESEMLAKFTRKGRLESGAKAGTLTDPKLLKNAGLPSGASFDEIASATQKAYNDLKPSLKNLFKTSAEKISKMAEAGNESAIEVMKGRAFKAIMRGALPMAMLGAMEGEVVEGVANEKQKEEFRKRGA